MSGATDCLLAFRFTEAEQAHYPKINAGYTHGLDVISQKPNNLSFLVYVSPCQWVLAQSASPQL
jgi:hypothetical protein